MSGMGSVQASQKASCWASFNGSGQTISNSFNVDSITRVNTGIYWVNKTVSGNSNGAGVACSNGAHIVNAASYADKMIVYCFHHAGHAIDLTALKAIDFTN